MRKIREVLRLSAMGLAQHQIACSCSIVQSTVHRYLKLAEAAQLRWPLARHHGIYPVAHLLLCLKQNQIALIFVQRRPVWCSEAMSIRDSELMSIIDSELMSIRRSELVPDF